MAIARLRDAGDDDEGEDGNDSLFAEINITPLTDVFLVMVVIFMVSALAEVEQNRKEQKEQQSQQSEQQKKSGLKINLPSGKAAEIDTKKASLVLEVPLTGDIAVGGKTFADASLDNLFNAAYQKDQETQVIIKADKGVAHGRVVNLMERAKQAGLTHLAIGTSGI